MNMVYSSAENHFITLLHITAVNHYGDSSMNEGFGQKGSLFEKYFTYQELAVFLQSLSASNREFCRLGSIGKSREGRDINILTITDFSSGKPQDKPAYLIHGNIHAAELSGTQSSLYTAVCLLEDENVKELLRNVVFYIVPRLNPDGAEYVITTSGPVRSRTERSLSEPNTLYPGDLNGDGLILTMRQKHPDGDIVSDPEDPRLLIKRKFDSKGPFYRILPEGELFDWDGGDDISIDGRGFDWNRNWSYDWRPEPEQEGAGDFPFSETEMRCIAGFIHNSPNLFGILGYHTGPAGVLRPPSTGSDSDLDEHDLRMMEDLGQMGAEFTGFPVIPVVKYRNIRDRDKNLRGHFHNFGYHHLGLYVFEFELGTIQNSAGISTEEQFGAWDEDGKAANLRKVMRWWDKRPGKLPLFKNWEKFEHHQLGEVEIGGFLRQFASNPTLQDLAEISAGTYKFTVSHALKHPKVTIENINVDNIGENIFRIRARVANRGEFPTNVSAKGKNLNRLKPVCVGFSPSEGVELLSRRRYYNLGHLAGITASRTVEWFVRVHDKEKKTFRIQITGGAGGNIYHSIKLE